MADIIHWEVSTFSIVVKLFHDCVSEVGVPSYYICCFIYIIPGKAIFISIILSQATICANNGIYHGL